MTRAPVPTILPIARPAVSGAADMRTIPLAAGEELAAADSATVEAALAILLQRYTGEDVVAFAVAAAAGAAVVRSIAVPYEQRLSSWLRTLAAERPRQLEAAAAALSGEAAVLVEVAIDLPGERPLTLLTRAGLALRFDAARLPPALAARVAAHLSSLLAAMTADEECEVGELPLLTAAERVQLLVAFNDTERDFPRERCIHQLIEQRSRARPEAIAVRCGDQMLSYAELEARSNQLAHQLRSKGVAADGAVGVFMERSLELVIAIVGVLKAGGAYAPIDPSYPAERVAFMMADVRAPVLLTQPWLLEKLPSTEACVITLDEGWPATNAYPTNAPALEHDPENLAYIIYTSGSTGTPKGIAIRHRGALNNIVDLNTRYGVGPGDSMLVLSSLSFDMCVYEVLGTLVAGATMVMTEPSRGADPQHWAALVREHGVSIWNSAPQLLAMFIDHVEERPDVFPRTLRLAILGGDWVPVTLPDRFKAITAEGARVIVLGGATEASIHSTLFEVEGTDPNWKSIPYGRPMFNQTCYVLDSRQRLCPIGIPGELHLGGVGLARGYLGRPELTAEKFIGHPFRAGERLYKTGDRVYVDGSGCLHLLGRIDFMVKIRGQRIELGEIEAALRKREEVRDAVVMVRHDPHGDQRLVAYLVAGAEGRAVVDGEVTHSLVAQLRTALGEALPKAMVPSAFVVLDALPLTPNGKVDRTALPLPQLRPAHDRPQPLPPRDALETVLTSIWAEVLGAEEVGVHDNFFALGGHSLSATRIMARLRDVFPLEMRLSALFDALTVAAFATYLKQLAQAAKLDLDSIAELVLEVDGLSDEELAAMLGSP